MVNANSSKCNSILLCCHSSKGNVKKTPVTRYHNSYKVLPNLLLLGILYGLKIHGFPIKSINSYPYQLSACLFLVHPFTAHSNHTHGTPMSH